jgi:hypothetical protein
MKILLKLLKWAGALLCMVAAHPRGAYGPRPPSQPARQRDLP